MENWERTVISQYYGPTIRTLIYAMNQWKDPRADIHAFYRQVFDIATARGYGLDVWGRILGIGRVLDVAVGDPYWGFTEATVLSAWPFDPGGGIFYGGEAMTGNYALTDDGFRVLLMAKAAFNICSASAPAINQILMTLFPNRGNCYVVDNHDMTMTYVFDFAPSPVEASIIERSGVLPKPTGVAVSYQLP